MKKLILILIALTTFMNVSYASFPIEKEFNLSYRIEYIDVPVYSDTLKNDILKYGILAGSTIDETLFWEYRYVILLVVLGFLVLGMSAMKMN